METIMNTGTEVVVTAPDRVGILSDISTAVAEAHIRIKAICAYEVDDVAHLRLVTEDDKKAIEALTKAGYRATEHEVLYCEVSPQDLAPAHIAGSYDVENNYWCASAHTGEHAVVVFSPRENLKAASIR